MPKATRPRELLRASGENRMRKASVLLIFIKRGGTLEILFEDAAEIVKIAVSHHLTDFQQSEIIGAVDQLHRFIHADVRDEFIDGDAVFFLKTPVEIAGEIRKIFRSAYLRKYFAHNLERYSRGSARSLPLCRGRFPSGRNF